ncbi:MAG: ECF transporter S component [Ruminococcaceae bacterium]|nr:ECF transporter S component [Oscillospiraceae bacterium]
MKNRIIKKITYCAVLIALGMVLPFLTGQIPEVGSALSPIHIPALLAGFTVGPVWGGLCAFIIPILRSLIFIMPPLFPKALAMAFEMAAYAAVCGILQRNLPKSIGHLYLSQISAMLAGRIVYGIVFALFTMNNPDINYGFTAFIMGSFVEAVPGIVLHLAIVPPIVLALRKARLTVE